MQYTTYYKRKLPHFQPKKGVFFITLRQAFSLPEKYLRTLNQYRESLQIQYAKYEDTALAKAIIKKKSFAYEDDLYDKCAGEADLTSSPAAEIIRDKLLAMHNEQFYLYAFTIMPNHVHILIRPLQREGLQIDLSGIIKNIKGATARLINQAVERQGQLWFREYHDHWIRSQQELVNVIEYMRNNPVKAGLAQDPQQWQWTWLNPELWQEE